MAKRNWWKFPGTSSGNTLETWRRKRKGGKKSKNIGGTTYWWTKNKNK